MLCLCLSWELVQAAHSLESGVIILLEVPVSTRLHSLLSATVRRHGAIMKIYLRYCTVHMNEYCIYNVHMYTYTHTNKLSKHYWNILERKTTCCHMERFQMHLITLVGVVQHLLVFDDFPDSPQNRFIRCHSLKTTIRPLFKIFKYITRSDHWSDLHQNA